MCTCTMYVYIYLPSVNIFVATFNIYKPIAVIVET